MTGSNEQVIIDRWKDEPAPLLPVLQELHDRDGYLSEEALHAVAVGLRIPIADLFGTVTFYHHFSREPGGLAASRVCTGPVCKMKGADALVAALEGATPMPCSGRCDDPIPVLQGHDTLVGLSADTLESRPSPLPPTALTGVEECVFAHIREPGRASLSGYEKTGGYEGLREALEKTPEDILQVMSDSGLAGRGGAGFPTGVKWKAVADAEGHPKTIVCNADEGEPGCFKDRCLMDYDPHAIVEGMVLAAYATGATRGFIYLRYEYPETERVLDQALAEAHAAGFLGTNILGSDFEFDLYVRRGAGAYICGEETSLLNSLEGKHPFPRNRPPYPVTHGFEDLPTVVNNVETLASVAPIVRRGAEWYKSLGRGEQAGTKVISLSGDVVRPGNYEVPLGFPLLELIQWAGGVPEGRSIQAVTMAGLSGGFLAGDDMDVTLDEPSIRSKGSFLGAGGIMVFDDSRDMIEVSHQAMEFFAHESCGKCFPCRIGTQRLMERLAGKAGPKDLEPWIDEVADLGKTMMETSACGLGVAAPLITNSLLKYFPEQVSDHVKR
jgi:NADH-quinone oxidoreductase subunit F